MSLEKIIMDLTSKTPSGGTCWIGDIPFTVWYCSDYWEWEFQGVFYFDLLDLSEAMEAFLQRTAESLAQAASLSKKAKAWLKPIERKRITFPSKGSTSGLVSGLEK
jgi:hypothetical protein